MEWPPACGREYQLAEEEGGVHMFNMYAYKEETSTHRTRELRTVSYQPLRPPLPTVLSHHIYHSHVLPSYPPTITPCSPVCTTSYSPTITPCSPVCTTSYSPTITPCSPVCTTSYSPTITPCSPVCITSYPPTITPCSPVCITSYPPTITPCSPVCITSYSPGPFTTYHIIL